MTPSPLRVIDLCDALTFQAARLLVGLGADVIRVECTDTPVLSKAERLHWHAGKRVVTVASHDIEKVVQRLVPDADVVLESGSLRALRTLAMREQRPGAWTRTAHVVTTPFGLTGPRREWLADDLVLTAAGGMAWLGGDPGESPEPPPREQATQLAGVHAAIGALLALVARRRTGRGQLVEVSAQEAVAATLETGAISWIHGGTVPGRTSGVYGHVAHRVFAAADGHLGGGYSGSPRMWDDLLAWMLEEGAAADLAEPRWQDPDVRWQGRPHVDGVVAAFVADRPAAAFAEEARRRALPWAEVASPSRLLDNPQLRHRGFLAEVEDNGCVLTDVGFPFASPALPRPVRLASPADVPADVCWHEVESSGAPAAPAVPAAPPALPAGRPARPARSVRGPGALAGIRVLDLTWVLAGPYATKILGEHGAEIIKVESQHRKDPTRFAPGMRLRPGATFDDSGYFLNFNRNKQSLALNLRTAQGQDLLRRLVPHVDVVVENFSPGVLTKWGLAYEQLRELNPDVVLVSMAGVGQDGPWRNAVTFADTLAAMSGLTFETGLGRPAPQGLTFGLGDMVAANAAVLATLELLYAGRGGHVDLSQLEAMASSLGAALLETQTGETAGRCLLPPRVVRTSGEDRWLAVGAVESATLRIALPALSDAAEDELDKALAEIALGHEADALAEALQAAGVAAYPVRDGRDLVEADAQLGARSFYRLLPHPLAGDVLHEGLVEHLAETPGDLRTPAPLLGQHTDELLARLLGLSAAELTDLHREGALE
ncbi:hypothetical protein JCM18899A_42450 [Nocardioides sp. AN3]